MPFNCAVRVVLRTTNQMSLDLFLQINLFKSVEEMIKIFEFCALRWSGLERFLRKRFKQTYTVKCDSQYKKVAFLWGDGIKDIIKQCRKENEVYFHSTTHHYVAIPSLFLFKCRSLILTTLKIFCKRYRFTCKIHNR